MSIEKARKIFGRQIENRHDLLAVKTVGEFCADEIGFVGFFDLLRREGFDSALYEEIAVIQPDGWALRRTDDGIEVIAFEVECTNLMTLSKLERYVALIEAIAPARLRLLAVDPYGVIHDIPLMEWAKQFPDELWSLTD